MVSVKKVKETNSKIKKTKDSAAKMKSKPTKSSKNVNNSSTKNIAPKGEGKKVKSSKKQNIEKKPAVDEPDVKVVKSTHLQINFPEGQPCYKKALQTVLKHTTLLLRPSPLVIKTKTPEEAKEVVAKLKEVVLDQNRRLHVSLRQYIPTKRIAYFSDDEFPVEKVKKYFNAQSVDPIFKGSKLRVLTFKTKQDAADASVKTLVKGRSKIELSQYYEGDHKRPENANAGTKRKMEDEVPSVKAKVGSAKKAKTANNEEEEEGSDEEDEEEDNEGEEEEDNEGEEDEDNEGEEDEDNEGEEDEDNEGEEDDNEGEEDEDDVE